ncbi:MAG: MBL fold metallo-hydrolase [Janthinobacterium lividum]
MSVPEPWSGGPVTDRATCVLQANPGPMTLEGTNTWVLSEPGSSTAVVVDPGEDDPAHRAAIAAVIGGRRVALVVVTHHHRDHVGGLDAFTAEHPCEVVRCTDVADGAERDVDGLVLRFVHSPGHTSDSLSIQLADGSLLSGDTLLGRGSTVIAADGDLGDYLATMRKLLRTAPTTLLPGHGSARPDAAAALATQLAHRLDRLGQVGAAVDAGARSLDEIVVAVHGSLEPTLARAARSSIQAQLTHLGVELGR